MKADSRSIRMEAAIRAERIGTERAEARWIRHGAIGIEWIGEVVDSRILFIGDREKGINIEARARHYKQSVHKIMNEGRLT